MRDSNHRSPYKGCWAKHVNCVAWHTIIRDHIWTNAFIFTPRMITTRCRGNVTHEFWILCLLGKGLTTRSTSPTIHICNKSFHRFLPIWQYLPNLYSTWPILDSLTNRSLSYGYYQLTNPKHPQFSPNINYSIIASPNIKEIPLSYQAFCQ